MTLSRTARILLALLLLAAAAFFWVNFFTQNRVLGEDPETPATAAVPPAPTPAEPADAVAPDDIDADAPLDADVDVDADAVDVAVDVDVDVDAAEPLDAEADAVDPLDAEPTVVAPPADAPEAPVVPGAPVVVIDPPVTVTRDVVVADLPFLVTEPPTAPEPTVDELAAAAEAERQLAAARATVNPFSPIVRPTATPTATAPGRDVPAAPVVTDVAVPEGPPAPAPRVATPAPRALAPAPTAVRDTPRALPTGTPLAATPGLLRETRTVDAVEPVEVPAAATRVPDQPLPTTAEPVRTAPGILSEVPELRGIETTVTDVVTNGEAPLAAGTNRLARYLRDNGYSFTGSVLGPVSVGVFRSNGDPVPQVVALGQTLPNTEIVLTDLRGQQAELMLDDLRQTLILDIRR